MNKLRLEVTFIDGSHEVYAVSKVFAVPEVSDRSLHFERYLDDGSVQGLALEISGIKTWRVVVDESAG